MQNDLIAARVIDCSLACYDPAGVQLCSEKFKPILYWQERYVRRFEDKGLVSQQFSECVAPFLSLACLTQLFSHCSLIRN